ncbi:type VI secretion system contractile sheath large subunit [Microbulbifer sp.]|uniref:type VI secretion system contractile sheath domain-containing protein n=1 Tax=Microbulbifer sp. TaxID=1908541 RepID=UPI00258FF3BD|nr:type VI secretion system contractile sheath large subunit [Microbulbifer sp.]
MSASQNRLKVAILGDFSGRASRGLCEPESISQRPSHRVRKDNFETLFERMGVAIKLPVSEAPIALLEFDDLHPDFLYHRLALFQEFIKLEKQLLDPARYADAVAEIQQWDTGIQSQSALQPESSAAQSMLDAILSGNGYRADDLAAGRQQAGQGSAAAGIQVDRLIKDIVAPYVQAKPAQDQSVYLNAVNEAASEAMRKIMHHSDFRHLEASWRSLHLLLRRLDDHPGLELHLIDVTKDEIFADFVQAEDDLEQSQLFKRLVQQESVAGDTPFNLILGDFYIRDDERDLHGLIDLATIAEAAGSAVILGGDNRLAGCTSLAGSLDPEDWQYQPSEDFERAWQAIREFSGSRHLALAAPRFMLRLPFGADTARTESFDFEELTEDLGHQYYLWGNSAYLVLLSLCQKYTETGSVQLVTSGQFTDLPLHLRKRPQGTWLTPCAEALLSDQGAARFTERGLSTLRSVADRDQILLPRLQSLAGTWLAGPWA